jgi:hypothetical protein
VRLVQLCFDFYMIEAKPENLSGDRAYDSDPLDEQLRRDGIAMIAPHSNDTAASSSMPSLLCAATRAHCDLSRQPSLHEGERKHEDDDRANSAPYSVGAAQRS